MQVVPQVASPVARASERPSRRDTQARTEWSPAKRWNPFNSYKLLSHVHRWSYIRRGRPLPPPVLVTVDPTNVCNLNCAWCNAEYIRQSRRQQLSPKALRNLARFLPRWTLSSSVGSFGVDAICIAGGGEPLLNPATADFIDGVTSGGIEVGLVTNGIAISDYIDALSLCTWVGVSVDAATPSTYNRLKGLGQNNHAFGRVVENIAVLADYSRRYHRRLGYEHPAYGVSFKYLLYDRANIGEVYQAAKLAKEIGCKNIHFRPAGTSWDKLGTDREVTFSAEDIALFEEQVKRAMELDDESFGVYGITHKFNSQFSPANYFCKCHAVFMTAVIMPPAQADAPADAMVVGLCCDRRGDTKLELASQIEDPQQLLKVWGSTQHWKIHDDVNVRNECPRCTYQPHNEVFEQVILRDSMTYKFI